MTARLSCRSPPVAPRGMAPAEAPPEVVGTWYSSRGMVCCERCGKEWCLWCMRSREEGDGSDGRMAVGSDGVGEIG